MIGERRRAQEGDDEGKGGPEEEAMVVAAWSQKNHPCCRFRQDKKYIKDK